MNKTFFFLTKSSRIFLSQSARRMGYMTDRDPYWLERIGNREMVGFGFNGLPVYADRSDFPFPAIRYKEVSGEVLGIFEKQKGDWHLLTKNEKKTLYRANFCQTFAEMDAPTGEWMRIIGYGLIFCSFSLWFVMFLHLCVYDPKPHTFFPNNIRAQLRRRIDIQANPIFGLSSNWDYEKCDWKVKTWFTPPNPFSKCEDD